MNPCAERKTELSGLLFGGLSGTQRDAIVSHVHRCADCASALRRMRAADDRITKAIAWGESSKPRSRGLGSALWRERERERRKRTLSWCGAAAAAASIVLAAFVALRGDGSSSRATVETARSDAVLPPASSGAPASSEAARVASGPPVPRPPTDHARSGTGRSGESPRPAARRPAETGPSPAAPATGASEPSEVVEAGPPEEPVEPEPSSESATGAEVASLPKPATAPADAAAAERARAAAQVIAAAQRQFEAGEWRRAATTLARMRDPGPGPEGDAILLQARLLEGWCALRERDVAAAERAFGDALRRASVDPQGLAGAGLAALAAGKPSDAARFLKEAAHLWPECGALNASLGWALLDANAPADARRAFDLAREAVPDGVSAVLGSAWCAYRQGELEAAEAGFAAALPAFERKAPGDAQGEVDERWLVSIEEQRVRAQERLGAAAGFGFCAWSRGDATATLRRLEPVAARKAGGDDEADLRDEVAETIAWAKLDLGRASAALKDFERLSASAHDERERTRAAAARGWCQIALGRTADARATFEKALATFKAEPVAIEGLAVLDGRAMPGRVPWSARGGMGRRGGGFGLPGFGGSGGPGPGPGPGPGSGGGMPGGMPGGGGMPPLPPRPRRGGGMGK